MLILLDAECASLKPLTINYSGNVRDEPEKPNLLGIC